MRGNDDGRVEIIGLGKTMGEVRKDEAGTRQATRRAFLEKCGKFAIVTPPVMVALLVPRSRGAHAQEGNADDGNGAYAGGGTEG